MRNEINTFLPFAHLFTHKIERGGVEYMMPSAHNEQID